MPKLIRSACLTNYMGQPERVCCPYAPPAAAVAHVRFVGCPVDVRCDTIGLASAAKALDVRLPKGDSVMARYAQQYLDSILEHPHATTADKVCQFVRALLPSGRCSIEQVAQHLGMDRRARPLAEVADLLGFSGLSALSRWFSGHFDGSASAWRAAPRGRMVPAR